MATFTFTGSAASDEIDVDKLTSAYYADSTINAGDGDDEIIDTQGKKFDRVTLNGEAGDDSIYTFGRHDAWLAGGNGRQGRA